MIRLLDVKTGAEIKRGDTVRTFRGEKAVLEDFYTKPAPSTGRVCLRLDGYLQEYYPSVINAVIVGTERDNGSVAY